MNIRYHDAHLHLTGQSIDQENLLIQKARRLGVCSFKVNTAQPDEWHGLEILMEKQTDIIPFFGIHPWFINSIKDSWDERLYTLLQKTMVHRKVGIGEIGLDKKCATKMEQQEKIFIQQLEMAQELNIPVTIHCLKKWGRIVEIVEQIQPSIPLIFHSYNGSYDTMKRLMKHHSLFSFQGKAIATTKQQELLQKIPLQHILLETDLCHPVEKGAEDRAHRDLISFYEEVAELRGMNLREFAHQVETNGEI